MAKSYKAVAVSYAKAVVSGEKIAGREIVLACRRFLSDLEREDLEYHVMGKLDGEKWGLYSSNGKFVG